jgi:hypothetical protein
MHSPNEANRMRWQFQPGHYEVWYATLSDPASQTGFWIRHTLEAPLIGHGEPSARLWFARFDASDPARTFGFSRGFSIDQLRHEAEPFSVAIGPATLHAGGMRGSLEAPATESSIAHAVAWDLTWQPAQRPHLMLPTAVYKMKFPDTLFVVPNQNVAARGHLTVDGQRYELDGAPLGQAHVWGRKHAYSWAWSHCNGFEGDRGASLESLTVRLRRGPIVLPRLTLLTLYLEGDQPAVIDFREPWQLPLARSDYATGRYHLLAANAETKVEAEFTCRPEDMILTEYVDPDGDAAFCHNTECADARVTVWRRSPFVGRFREHRRLRAPKTGHFEWGARAGDPLVQKRHLAFDGR